MRLAIYDTHRYDRQALEGANAAFGHELVFFEARLDARTAALATDCQGVCVFVNDHLDAATIAGLRALGVRLIALRCAGFNNVDLAAATEAGLRVVRVPEYSPHAVAEHAVALILALNRRIPRAHDRVRDGNFTLDGLVGFDLYGKTVGVIGTGRIGTTFARIMVGFGCQVLAYDLQPNIELTAAGVRYVPLTELYRSADIVSLHLPLLPSTRHLIDAAAIAAMQAGVMLINTGRGGLIDSRSLLDGLKCGHVGYAGLDVYEEEEGIFFCDLSEGGVPDDLLARLLTFPNVLVTAHQAFLTREALAAIAQTTLANVTAFETGAPLANEVLPPITH